MTRHALPRYLRILTVVTAAAAALLVSHTATARAGSSTHSASSKDVSWHWTWSCDEAVTLRGTSSLYDEGYRIRTVAANGTGRSGTENVRYGTCVEAPWWGTAVYTFSAPGYTSGSGEGSSPTSTINCP